jgi:hypothetical protein
MRPFHRAGPVLAASLLMLTFGPSPSDAYPWPKRRQVIIGQAPAGMVVGQAPAGMVVGQAPGFYTVGQAPTAAAAPTYVIQGTTAASGAAPASTSGTSSVVIGGQTFTLSASGAAPSTSSSEKCELSANVEEMLLEELREYKNIDLKGVTGTDRRQQLIDRAVELLADYCDEANELTVRSRARKLADEVLAPSDSGQAPTVLGSGFAPSGGYIVPAQPMLAPAVMPQPMMIQPVVPVLLQPVQPSKCWRCLHRAFCPHKSYP